MGAGRGTDALIDRLAMLRRSPVLRPADLGDYELLDPSDNACAEILRTRCGLRVEAPAGNLLVVHRKAGRVVSETPISMRGSGNLVMIDRECGFHGNLEMNGEGNAAIFQGGQQHAAIGATFYGGDTLLWGHGASSWGIRIWIQGGTTCAVGEDSLFSENITIRTTDHHTMFDIDTNLQLNAPADVVIGRHVWVGQDCAIGKGAVIGDGSIIGARSLVIGAVGPAQLWAGAPARMLRDRVSWVHSHPHLDEAERKRVMALIARPIA